MSAASSQVQQQDSTNTAAADAFRMALAQAALEGPALSLPGGLAGVPQAPSDVNTSIDWNEERIDPDQRKVWSFHEYHAAHIGAYNFQDIQDYWRITCRPFSLADGQKVCPPANTSTANEDPSEAEFAQALYTQLAVEQDAAKQEVADRQRVLDTLGQSIGVGAPPQMLPHPLKALPGPAEIQDAALQQAAIHEIQQAALQQVAMQEIQQAALQQVAMQEIQQAALQQVAMQEIQQAALQQVAMQEIQQLALQQAAIQQVALQQAALLQQEPGTEPQVQEEALKQAAMLRLALEQSLLGGDDAGDDEMRQDPEGKTWRYSDYREANIGQYNLVDIRDYWRIECKEVGSTELPAEEVAASKISDDVAPPAEHPAVDAADKAIPDVASERPAQDSSVKSISDDITSELVAEDTASKKVSDDVTLGMAAGDAGGIKTSDDIVSELTPDDAAGKDSDDQKSPAEIPGVVSHEEPDRKNGAPQIQAKEMVDADCVALEKEHDSDEENNRNASNSPRRVPRNNEKLVGGSDELQSQPLRVLA